VIVDPVKTCILSKVAEAHTKQTALKCLREQMFVGKTMHHNNLLSK